jgi:hypothetical protein
MEYYIFVNHRRIMTGFKNHMLGKDHTSTITQKKKNAANLFFTVSPDGIVYFLCWIVLILSIGIALRSYHRIWF